MSDLADQMEAVARKLLGPPPKPPKNGKMRYGTKGSLAIDLRKGTFYDHETKEGGGVLEFVRRYGSNGEDPIAWLRREGFVKDDTVVETFDYPDEKNELSFQVCRTAAKNFFQRRPDGKAGWINNLDGVQRVLYRLPELLAGKGKGVVGIPEGEKHVNALIELGLRATCNPMGAGNWRAEYNEHLRGEDVVILPDNDPQATDKNGKLRFYSDGRPVFPGQDHAQTIALNLHGVAGRVRVLMLPGLGPKGDVINWLEAGGTREELEKLAAATADWTPQPKPKATIHATPYVWIKPEDTSRRQWLYKPSYIRQFTSMLVATSKGGKSGLLIGETLSMVSHRALLGIKPVAPLRVWYWNGEDPIDEINRHFVAAIKHHKLTKEDIGDRLFVDSGRTMPIVIAEMGKYGTTMIATPIVDGVIAALRDNHIDILIIDPFVSCHHVTENDNVAIERVAKQWANIAEVTDTAIRYAHHSRKTGGEPVTGESQRGASANYAAVRCVDTLNYMTEREANNVGMSPRRRKFYFRQDDENNLLPPAENSKWYEKISVDLGNAPYPEESDKIGVVVPWSYPQTNDVKTTPNEQIRIQEVLGQREWWRANSQANDWVGVPIGSVLGIDTKSARGRKQVATIITDLVGKGLLIKTERMVRRKPVPVYIARLPF